MSEKRIIIVGGGLAGLMNAITACELGYSVDLISYVAVRRSHSVCAQGGINGAVNTMGEGDSPEFHFDDSVYGGDFLANQPMVKDMCYDAPKMIYLLDRMGVTFNRTSEGLLDFRRFGGTLFNRTAFAGATTGQQLIYALDEQVRKWEGEGKVRKFEHHSFQSVILDGQRNCRGIVLTDLHTMKTEALLADAVSMCTGGNGLIYGQTTMSTVCTGSAASRCYQQGVWYANPEFIQIHPTAIPGTDKCRLISESVRGEGGRVWVPKKAGDTRKGVDIPENDRWYFLEERYPAYGNLVPRDIASRELFDICVNEGKGVGGGWKVYLDVSHLDDDFLRARLGGVLEIYEKFAGEDPYHNPMMVFPEDRLPANFADYKHMTNVSGLFAGGEADYQYHGANRLGANSLLSCIWAGRVLGPEMVKYVENVELPKLPENMISGAVAEQELAFDKVRGMERGQHNPHHLQREMQEIVTLKCSVVRDNDELKEVDAKLDELLDKWDACKLADTGNNANQEIIFIRELRDQFLLAKTIVQGAIRRDESRGGHYKTAFPKRNDAEWLKTTICEFDGERNPKFSYEDVDISLIPPRVRSYETASHGGQESAEEK
jgi:succinate dehydrogenase / fumarate reductase flavoprotein subunit